MRLFPPVFAAARTLATPTEIDGCKFPAGTSVSASIYVAHHHPDFWENPEVRPYYLMVHRLILEHFRTLTLCGSLLKGQKDDTHMLMCHSLLDQGKPLSHMTVM